MITIEASPSEQVTSLVLFRRIELRVNSEATETTEPSMIIEGTEERNKGVQTELKGHPKGHLSRSLLRPLTRKAEL
jgi:hypothetical protein